MKEDVNKVSVLCPKCRYEFKVKRNPDYVYCTACGINFHRESNLKKKDVRQPFQKGGNADSIQRLMVIVCTIIL